MMRLAFSVAFLAIIFLLPCQSFGKVPYKGFVIDDSECCSLPQMNSMVSLTEEQIDIATSVGEPQSLIIFFQNLPIALKSLSVPGGTPGLYLGGAAGGVEIYPSIMFTGHKPVLLHEMLHAYHDRVLPDGFMNAEIMRYYFTAKSLHLFDNQSHMMSNQREFFACAATTYLYGVTAQEPFTRDRLKQCDPEFYSYLQKLFGPGAGNYSGWLSLMKNMGTSNQCMATAIMMP
jgi:hypothetical protein